MSAQGTVTKPSRPKAFPGEPSRPGWWSFLHLIGEHRLLGHFGRTLEIDLVTVRVDHSGYPHGIADEWPLGRNPSRGNLAVNLHCIAALETDGDTLAQLSRRHSPL